MSVTQAGNALPLQLVMFKISVEQQFIQPGFINIFSVAQNFNRVQHALQIDLSLPIIDIRRAIPAVAIDQAQQLGALDFLAQARGQLRSFLGAQRERILRDDFQVGPSS